jgi:D-arabinose 5-phosphate isomerase GutQ
MKEWNIFISNSTIRQGHFQQVLKSQEKQLEKVEHYISILDNYKRGLTPKRNIIKCGEGRSGHVEAIDTWNLRGAGISAYYHKWDRTPRFMPGDIYEENTGGGNKIAGLNRLYAATKELVNTAIYTSNLDRPATRMVRGQLDGINIGDKRFPDFKRTKRQKAKFEKTYGRIDPEMQIRFIPGREDTLADLEETSCLAPSGDLFEWSSYLVKTNEVLTYNKWNRGECEKASIGNEFLSFMEETERGLRDGIPVILDQRDVVERMCEDTYNKKLVLISGVGSNSSKLGSVFEMRGGQSGMEEIIHIDLDSEKYIDLNLKALSPEEIKKDVRMITVSNSLETDAVRQTVKYQKAGVIPYIITSNIDHPLSKKNSENCLYIPNEPSHVFESGHEITFFHPLAFAVVDDIASVWLKKKKTRISKTHKED